MQTLGTLPLSKKAFRDKKAADGNNCVKSAVNDQNRQTSNFLRSYDQRLNLQENAPAHQHSARDEVGPGECDAGHPG